ncbi:hypothetical protein L596_020508 [Steinernema carpocapsae]|uniref:Serpentine receptor class gamma n=1 Tax=Steinernema carpocapsae TaxID=34508 RepID=A0A4U5MTR2_STECR|nr:hypothetical protein L596_020508 [Steinernema carpocapsae]
MDLFLFDHDQFETLYNCSFKTDAEWLSYGVQNYLKGNLFVLLGFFYIIAYIPILVIMTRPKLFRNSCFKILFFLGLIDIMSTVANCIIVGYAGLKGVPHWIQTLFDGPRIMFWIIFCLGYGLSGIFFCTPPIFSSFGMALFFDPYFMISMEAVPIDRSKYMSAFHSINNIVMIIVLPSIYILILFSVWSKTQRTHYKLFMQAFYICLLNFVAAFVYVYMQFFPIPMFLITVGQMMWQGSDGGAVVVYLTVNKTIRNGVFELICCGKFK